MAGFGPAIHVFLVADIQNVDARHNAGHTIESYFFTSGQSLASSGFAASSAEIVAICL